MVSVAPAYAADQTAPKPVKISKTLVAETIKPQLMQQVFEKQQIQKATKAKLASVKQEEARMTREKEARQAAIEAQQEAQAAADRQEREAEVAAEKQAQEAEQQEQAAAEQKQTTFSQAPRSSQPSQQTSGTNKGTFKLSFYDPQAMGSGLGYGGVAANLSVFPKGTRLEIILSDGTVWYRTVNDTGGFASANPNQLDVAMPNSQIPSAGVMTATVIVLN